MTANEKTIATFETRIRQMILRFQQLKKENQQLVEAVKKLNDEIIADASLGKGFVIGHSFFCGRVSPEEIVRYEIGPTLDEYWFDNQSKADEERNKLLNAIR